MTWNSSTSTGPLVRVFGLSTLSIRYTDLTGGTEAVTGTSTSTIHRGPGIIGADPLFADSRTNDYHLKSRYGRWDPAANAGAGAWITDTVTSPCIDAGDPAAVYSNEPQPNFGRINLGAYGNSPQASRSGWNIPGDANDTCSVNILDLIFVRKCLNQDVASDANWKADVNRDGKINILDLIRVRSCLNTRCR